LSTITVQNDADSGAGSLRAALADASSGDTIKFARSAYGTITLTSGPLIVPNINLTIEGPGASKLTISGNDAYTVFELGIVPHVAQTPSTMTISGMTIADGNALDNDDGGSGGGIAEAVNLTLANSVVEDNQAPNGSGGGISNGFESGLDLTIESDVFGNNTAGSASASSFAGMGGAIDAQNASIVSVSSSTFINNQSIDQSAQGGAINLSTNVYEFPNSFGSLSVTGSTFQGNAAISNSSNGGFAGFYAAGGAIWADPQVGVTIDSSRFIDNQANVAVFTGIAGFAAGGALDVNPGVYAFPSPPPSSVTITNTVFAGNTAVGTGTSGSVAEGGAINAGSFASTPGGGTITVTGSRFTANEAMGDSSSINPSDDVSGPAQGGAINTYLDALALTSDNFSGNEAVSGSGQVAAYAEGGAIFSQLYAYYVPPSPTLTTTISASQFTGNQAIGGAGEPTYAAYVDGGALALDDTPATVTNTVMSGNEALGSPGTAVSYSPPAYGPLGIGGAVEATGAALSIQGGRIEGNIAMGGYGGDATRGPAGTGGYGWGGGIFIGGQGSLTVSGTTIAGNSAIGNAGGNGNTGGSGGFGQGAGIYIYYGGSAKIVNAAIVGNVAIGGAGGQGATPRIGGDAQGGGVFAYAAALTISGGNIALNSALGGPGGGDGEGGGVFISGTAGNALLSDVSIALNAAIGGSGGGAGVGGGLYIGGGSVTLSNNTKVVGNFASTSNDNIYGPFTTI
jgi:hypothetical protein